ncbi:hypothetical protein [Mycobacterium sp. Aquia_213]|uniref:hypothetical protein n=1 Tax=Mycobacterium sp. Aquia_213 TaxID=2991728 RepID=UPI0022719791|nr:hypothetical protein [Mycobacterium sp. Aquia_213]WAC90216.1 hypothetical protein LMQ14_20115 [Mycobacterium sp. Aquia_213]
MAMSSTDRSTLTAAATAMLGTVATLGGLFSAIFFLSLNTRPTGGTNSALRSLYPTYDAIVMLTSLAASGVIGTLSILYLTVGENPDKLIKIQIALTIYVSCLVIPVGLRQIENLDTVAVARVILKKSSRRQFLNYRLARVWREDGEYRYALASDGLNYTRTDPLRPFHDLAQLAFSSGDRLLLGKLIGELASLVPKSYGHRWPSDRKGPAEWRRRTIPLLGYYGTNAPRDRIAISLHIAHYIRNTAKNNLVRQPKFDVGRHACQYHLARVISSLSTNAAARHTIRIALFAILDISLRYKDVAPYGRVEPLNAVIVATDQLYAEGRIGEAELSAAILGTIRARTKQLSDHRAGSTLAEATEPVRALIADAYSRAKASPAWVPGSPTGDPWRNHY